MARDRLESGTYLNPASSHPHQPIWSHLGPHPKNTKGRTPQGIQPFLASLVVGATGFEPATPRSRTECSTRLSHAPTVLCSQMLYPAGLYIISVTVCRAFRLRTCTCHGRGRTPGHSSPSPHTACHVSPSLHLKSSSTSQLCLSSTPWQSAADGPNPCDLGSNSLPRFPMTHLTKRPVGARHGGRTDLTRFC